MPPYLVVGSLVKARRSDAALRWNSIAKALDDWVNTKTTDNHFFTDQVDILAGSKKSPSWGWMGLKRFFSAGGGSKPLSTDHVGGHSIQNFKPFFQFREIQYTP